MVFRGFDIQAEISYRTIDTENYQWKRFTSPVYGGQYPRGTTRWEQECLDTIAVRAGTYTMHIVDTSEENLRSIVRKNK